jgi:soluble lytic murein transglycosylase-like protein
MRNLRGTYVHRGDGQRRLRRLKHALLLVATFAAATLLAESPEPQLAIASSPSFPFSLADASGRLRNELSNAEGELALANVQLERMHTVFAYSSRYGIGADLASSVYEIALAEGIDPELAFRIVKVESDFNEKAVSPVGAVGLTQLMLPTARYFDKNVTRDKLFDRETNLRIGFRYLRALVRENHGDLKLALLVYNRGPAAVEHALTQGRDPANGYDRVILKGYEGKGLVE